MESAKLIALLELIGGDIDSVEIQDENTVEVDRNEYKVLTDEEADDEFRDYQESLWDDMGIESFSAWAQQHILTNFVDVDWFNEAMKESYESYIDDIRNESSSSGEYESRLAEEMEEANVETEEDYVEHLCNSYSDGVQWYEESFGTEDLSKVVKDNNLVDFDKVVEWIRDIDGRGCIASYDGEEQESNGYYIYQIN